MSVQVTTAPAYPVITLEEARTHMRVTDTVEDPYIENLINVATTMIENITKRALINRTLKLTLPSFPDCDYIALPYAGLSSVTSVKYDDSSCVEQTFSNYWVDTSSEPGRVALKSGYSWPGSELLTSLVMAKMLVIFLNL